MKKPTHLIISLSHPASSNFIEFSNNFYDFQMNIRNKQRGLYPSHIMLDYTSKPATGKKKL